ncbi:FKBP-type peptidyl-prolyl cis-trans isomerase [Ekhidna sp.]
MKKIQLVISISLLIMFMGCGEDNDGPTFEEQLAFDQALIENHLTFNNIDTEIDESGIRYVLNNQGDGEQVQLGDQIVAKFTTTDLDGNILLLDTIGFTINLTNQVIRSWALMVPKLMEGGSITVYSPSGYAFGVSGNATVDPNKIVVFEIEVVAIIDSEDELLEVEGLLIDELLTESDIAFETHSSGIRYTVIKEGTGESPLADGVVSVIYEGSFLNGDVFDGQTEPTLFGLDNLVEAWQIMLPEMKEGGKIKFFAPSRYCYGTRGSNTIAPNVILAFEVELIEIQ